MACKAIADKDLVSAATTIFRGDGGSFVGLKATFESSNGFWRNGHTFDTIIDYFIEIEPADAAGFGQAALAAAARSMTNACWYDDYGWWGLAAQRASWHPKLFGDDDAKALGDLAYQQDDPTCFWRVFHDHAPNVWKNNEGNSALAVFQPRFAGGVWNCDWTQPDACGIVNGSPPLPQNCSDNRQGIKANLIGVQNTVTNALYFILAERLHVAYPAIPDFRAAALAELKFLDSWLFAVNEADLSLLNRFGQAKGPAVIRERVGSYAYDQNTRSYPHVCGYHPEIAWSGDQGLMLEAMVDRMNVISPNSQRNTDLVSSSPRTSSRASSRKPRPIMAGC